MHVRVCVCMYVWCVRVQQVYGWMGGWMQLASMFVPIDNHHSRTSPWQTITWIRSGSPLRTSIAAVRSSLFSGRPPSMAARMDDDDDDGEVVHRVILGWSPSRSISSVCVKIMHDEQYVINTVYTAYWPAWWASNHMRPFVIYTCHKRAAKKRHLQLLVVLVLLLQSLSHQLALLQSLFVFHTWRSAECC